MFMWCPYTANWKKISNYFLLMCQKEQASLPLSLIIGKTESEKDAKWWNFYFIF